MLKTAPEGVAVPTLHSKMLSIKESNGDGMAPTSTGIAEGISRTRNLNPTQLHSVPQT